MTVNVKTNSIVSANNQAVKVFGYDLTELLSLQFLDLFAPESRENNLLEESFFGNPRNLMGRQKVWICFDCLVEHGTDEGCFL